MVVIMISGPDLRQTALGAAAEQKNHSPANALGIKSIFD
jgi:hypothetical protein